jgi:predicted nucleic acid-binding protein
VPVLFDTSMYLRSLRSGPEAMIPLEKSVRGRPLWLSSVVLRDLYAGVNLADKKIVEDLEREFGRAGRILAPTLADWSEAGRLLVKVRQKYGYEKQGLGRLNANALIAASASAVGVAVLTATPEDFNRLAEFCPLRWQVR